MATRKEWLVTLGDINDVWYVSSKDYSRGGAYMPMATASWNTIVPMPEIEDRLYGKEEMIPASTCHLCGALKRDSMTTDKFSKNYQTTPKSSSSTLWYKCGTRVYSTTKKGVTVHKVSQGRKCLKEKTFSL